MIAQNNILFVGKSDNPLDSMTMDYLQLEGYNVTLVEEADFKASGSAYESAEGYAGFDALFVSESIGSSSANNYLTAGFPIPCVVTEGYVVKTSRWGILADESENYFLQASSANLNADVLTIVITDNEHWITKDYEPFHELVWAETDDPTKLGVTAFQLSDDIDGAVPLGQFLFDMGGLPSIWAVPAGSTLHGSTTLPNMVFIGVIQTDVGQMFTYDFLDFIRKSIQWVTDDYVPEGISAPDSYHLVVGPNPTSGLVNVSLTLPEAGKVRIHLFDMTGKLMKSGQAYDLGAGYNTIQLDFSGLSDAQYIYEIATEGDILRGRIIKK
jgi:hypothetical protein